jgi:hypothetical protein
MAIERRNKFIAALEIVTALGIVLYWIAYFTAGIEPQGLPECYFAFENSFPLADLILASTLLSAGILMLKGYPGGRTLSHVCAGSLIFLGFVDFGFNFQNGMYLISTASMVANGIINAWCIGFGLAIVFSTLD